MSRNSGPYPNCIGKCKKIQAQKPIIGKRYELGQKLCQKCNRWVLFEGARCPCCNNLLRTSPKSGKSKVNVARI